MTTSNENLSRANISPTTVAEKVLFQLQEMFFEIFPDRPKEDFTETLVRPMHRDKSLCGDRIAKEYLSKSQESSGDEDDVEISIDVAAAALFISCAYCIQATKEDENGQRDVAWQSVGKAQHWSGLMLGVRAIQEQVKNRARAGAAARDAKYDVLRDLARDLAIKKHYPSRRRAAISIADEVVKAAKEKKLNMSRDQASTTIAGWLKGIPFGNKGATSAPKQDT